MADESRDFIESRELTELMAEWKSPDMVTAECEDEEGENAVSYSDDPTVVPALSSASTSDDVGRLDC